MNLNKSDNASNAGNQQETSFVSSNLINHKWGILRDYTPDQTLSNDFKENDWKI